MLYSIRKCKLLLSQLICSHFESEGFGGISKSRLSTSEIERAQSKDQMAQLINNREINPQNQEHRDFLKRFLESIGGGDGIQESDIRGGVFSGEKMALKRVVELLKALAQYKEVRSSIRGFTRSELDMLNDFYLERGSIRQTSSDERDSLSQDLDTETQQREPQRRSSTTRETPRRETSTSTRVGSNPFLADGPLASQSPQRSTTKPIKAEGNEFDSHNTIEESSSIRGFFSGRTDRTGYLEKHGDVKASIASFLRGKSILELTQIFDRFEQVAKRHERNGQLTVHVLNDGDFKSLLRSLGYKGSKGMLRSPEEIIAVYTTLKDMLDTQEKIGRAPEAQKIELFFDFDGNGVMDANKEMEHLYQTLEALHLRERTDGFDALATNLGFGSAENLYDMMSENLFDARERFQRAYHASIRAGHNPTELAKSGKSSEVARQMLQDKQQIQEQVTQAVDAFLVQNIDNNPELVHLPAQSKRQFKDEFRSKVALDGISMSYINNQVGVGTGINISEFTRNFLDSISIAANENGIGISVSKGLFKEFLNKYGSSVSVGISSTLTPFLGVTQSIGGHIDDPKELFEMTTRTKVKATAFGSISSGAMAGGVGLSRVDEQTSSGIEQMTKKASKLLTQVVEKIQAGETNYGGSKQEQETYQQLKQNFDMQTQGMTPEEKKQYASIFVGGYTQSYRDELYRQAQGGKLTSISAGVISITGFLNLPFVMVGGERISTSQQEVTRDVSRQLENTYTQIAPEKVGGHLSEYHGHRVFQFPTSFRSASLRGGSGQMDVSVGADSQAQVEASGGYIRIGGSLQQMNIVEYTQGGKLHRTLVIDQGKKDDAGRYLPTGGNESIRSNFSSPKGALEVLDTLSTSESEKLHSIASLLTGIIDHGAISDKNTVGMTRLQKAIHSFKTRGTPGLTDVWQQYLNVINYEGKGKSFQAYASQKGYGAEQVHALQSASRSLVGNQDKIYVLQALAMALSSRGAIQPQAEGYSLTKGKTINEYNKGGEKDGYKDRDQYFDTLMRREFQSLGGRIHQARNEWNQIHGSKSSYETVYVDNGLAFSGTDVARKNGSITPLTGSYELIGSGKDAMIDLGSLTDAQKKELVSKIPNYVLDNYSKTFQAYGVSLNSHQAVRNYLLSDAVQLQALYAKNAQCINDCIVLNVKTRDGRVILGAGAVASVDAQKNNVLRLGLTYAGTLEEEVDKEKVKEDKAKEEKAKEDKAKEDKSKEDKVKEDKSKEEKAKEDKARDDEGEDTDSETTPENSPENTEGESTESEGESTTSEDESTESEGESTTSEDESTESEGESTTSEDESTESEGESTTSESEDSESETKPEDSPEKTGGGGPNE